MVRNLDPLSRMRGSTTIYNKTIKSHRVQKPNNNKKSKVDPLQVRSTNKTSFQRQGSIGVGVATKNKTISTTKSHYNSPLIMNEKRDDDDNSLVSIGTFTVGEDTPRDDSLVNDTTIDNTNSEGSSENKRKVRWSTTVNDNLPQIKTQTSTGCGILLFPPLCYNDGVSSSSSSSNVADGKVITNIYHDIKNKVDNSVQLLNDKLSRLSLSFDNACGNSTIISTGGCNNGLSMKGEGECTKEINNHGGYTDNFTTITLDDSNDKVINEENDLLLNTDTTLKQEDMLPTTVQDVHSSSRTRVVTTSAATTQDADIQTITISSMKNNPLPTARRTVRQVAAPVSHAKLSSTSTKAKRILNNAKQQQQQQQRHTRDIAITINKRYNTKNVSIRGSSKNTSTTVLTTSSPHHPHDDKLKDSMRTIPTTSVKKKSSKSKRKSNKKKKKLIDKLKKPSVNAVNILLKSNNIKRMKNRGLLMPKLCLA